MAETTSDIALELTIRFSVAISDIAITLTSPRLATALTLKQQIRQRLPASYTSRRLRLIYTGKVLHDTDSLWSSLNLAKHASAVLDNAVSETKLDRKGKKPLHAPPTPAVRLYIHCSVGDALQPTELAAEASAAAASEAALRNGIYATDDTATGLQQPRSSTITTSTTTPPQPSSTTPRPRGFDRLTSTGFTPVEVAQLRAQFLANLSYTHTPADMPTGATLLALEDRWLDNDPSTSSSSPTGGADGDTWAAGGGSDEAQALDDFVWGNAIGFFWPLGALVWGFREEGVWTRRRQIAVFTGIMCNLLFGFASLSS